MKKIFTPIALSTLLLSLPALVYAQSVESGLTNIGKLVNTFTTSVVQALAYLMLTSAVTAFFFGIVQYIWGLRQGDAGKTKVGNNFMVWGLVALFVMFSVWGIVRYAQRIFGVTDTTITIPDIRFKGSTGGEQSSSAALPSAGTPAGGGSPTYRNASDVQSDQAAAKNTPVSTGNPCAGDGNGLTQYDPASGGCVKPSTTQNPTTESNTSFTGGVN